MKRIAFTLLLLVAFAEYADAQNFYARQRGDRTWKFSYGLGAAQYHGDLYDIFYDGMSAATGFSLGVGLSKTIGSQTSLRLDANYYQIGGDDADVDGKGTNFGRQGDSDRYLRNLSFRSRNLEIVAMASINLLPNSRGYARRPFVNPYIMLGFGWTTVNPKALLDGEWYLLRDYTTELGYAPEGQQNKGWTMVVPIGLGLRVRATNYIDIIFEASERFTFTDYLDDISTSYPSRQSLIDYHGPEKGEIAYRLSNRRGELEGEDNYREGQQRGNPEYNDAYFIFQVRLEMYMPPKFLKNVIAPGKKRPKYR